MSHGLSLCVPIGLCFQSEHFSVDILAPICLSRVDEIYSETAQSAFRGLILERKVGINTRGEGQG